MIQEANLGGIGPKATDLMWKKLPLSTWKSLIIYGSGIFVILVKFGVSDLGDSRGYFGWNRPNDSKSRKNVRSIAFGPNSTV